MQQYAVRDFEFRSGASHDFPFDVDFSAVFHGPDGRELVVPGFYDGDGIWKVRFSPTATGEWTFETRSTDADLDAIRGDPIQCTPNENPAVHGGLLVDRAHPHHFIWEDGTRYFLAGDECDWLFALELDLAERYLDGLAAHGFNHVLMQVYAHHADWGLGKPHCVSPPSMYPWAGTNRRPDHSQLNPNFFRHLDRVIDNMHQRGIVSNLMVLVHNKHVQWPRFGSPEDDRYWRYLVARYQAYCNIVWNLSKEGWYVKDPDYWDSRVDLIRRLDAYGRLITIHDVNLPKADFLADQQHSDFYNHIIAERHSRRWPVVNVEFGYEPGPIDVYHSTHPEELRRRLWQIYMAGGYGVYYYTNTAWDVVSLEPEPRGYDWMAALVKAFSRLPYWEMEPNNDLTDRGLCLAKPGEHYLVYLAEGGHATVEVEGAMAELPTAWINPRTGDVVEDVPVGNGPARLIHPGSFGFGDAVLHIGRPLNA